MPYAEQIDMLGFFPRPGEDLGAHARRSPDWAEVMHASVEISTVGADPLHGAQYTTAPVSSAHPFKDLLVSWNVDCPPHCGFLVELRVASPDEAAGDAAAWTPWMSVGDWGEVPAAPRVVTCEGGKIDTDYFHGERAFGRAQLRISAFSAPGAARRLSVQRLSACASDPALRVPYAPMFPSPSTVISTPPSTSLSVWNASAAHAVAVPFRSQRAEDAAISGRICSPTSLAMVLAFRGVDVATAAVAERAYDARHDIYGNWPRNVQAAYSFGVPGYLTRYTNWADVEGTLELDQPIIASIAARPGELHGAPYAKTAGHLLVITGFDEHGDVRVADPAAHDAQAGQTVYARAEMQTVWLDRGGTAYVLLPRP